MGLNVIIPDTMQVRSDGVNVVLLVHEREVGGSAAAAILDDDDDDDRDFPERARTAVEAVLNGVQDVVIEELKAGWPPPRLGPICRCQGPEQWVDRLWAGTGTRTRRWCGSTQSRSPS